MTGTWQMQLFPPPSKNGDVHRSAILFMLHFPANPTTSAPAMSPQGAHFASFSLPPRPTPALLARYGRWDSNAEEMGSNRRFDFDPLEEDGSGSRRKKRRWWSDDPGDDEEEEEEEMGIVEEVIDSIWMLKVFRSYGWTLPAILLSLLLATGPKAFLTAMAFPLGQSVVTLAYNRLSGRKRTRSRVQTSRGTRRRRRRKRPSNTASYFGMEETEGRGRNWNSRIRNPGSRSWVDDGDFSSEVSNGASSFGGWEELDGVRYREKSSGAYGRSSTETDDGSRKPSIENTPLLLRLLIAMFPVLGLWISMFW